MEKHVIYIGFKSFKIFLNLLILYFENFINFLFKFKFYK